jgi:hypothetical protein
MKKKRDPQFLKLLEMNGRLLDLGADLKDAINHFGAYNKTNIGMSPHMKEAVKNWNNFVDNEFVRIK